MLGVPRDGMRPWKGKLNTASSEKVLKLKHSKQEEYQWKVYKVKAELLETQDPQGFFAAYNVWMLEERYKATVLRELYLPPYPTVASNLASWGLRIKREPKYTTDFE